MLGRNGKFWANNDHTADFCVSPVVTTPVIYFFFNLAVLRQSFLSSKNQQTLNFKFVSLFSDPFPLFFICPYNHHRPGTHYFDLFCTSAAFSEVRPTDFTSTFLSKLYFDKNFTSTKSVLRPVLLDQ